MDVWVDANIMIHMQTQHEIQNEVNSTYGEAIEIEELMQEPVEDIEKRCKICGDKFKTQSKKKLICNSKDCKKYAYFKRLENMPQRRRVKKAAELYEQGWTFQEIYLKGFGNSRGNVELFVTKYLKQEPIIQRTIEKIESKREKNGV